MAMIAAIIGRILLGALFVFSGFGKVLDASGTAAYMDAESPFPGSWALGVGVFEIVLGLILASGFMTRIASLVLVGFTVVVTIFFHEQVTDQMQAAMALKNLAIIGGLLMVFAYGQLRGTADLWRERDRAHDAEVRAARADGRAEGLATSPVRPPADRDGDGHPDRPL